MTLDFGNLLHPHHRKSSQSHYHDVLLTPPALNQRRPSFVVTPPANREVPPVKNQRNDDKEEYQTSPLRGCRKKLRVMAKPHPAPMLPDSLDFSNTSSRSSTVYERLIPMHSPIGGVSRLNLDFISKLERSALAATTPASTSASDAIWEEKYASTNSIVNLFPTLQDDESIETKKIRRQGGAGAASSSLKMRRLCKDEYRFWDAL